MPNREDESFINQTDGLRYCSKHSSFYKAESGCHFCWLEDIKAKIENSSPLQKCLNCGNVSLYLNPNDMTYECLNPECKRIFKPSDLLGK